MTTNEAKIQELEEGFARLTSALKSEYPAPDSQLVSDDIAALTIGDLRLCWHALYELVDRLRVEEIHGSTPPARKGAAA